MSRVQKVYGASLQLSSLQTIYVFGGYDDESAKAIAAGEFYDAPKDQWFPGVSLPKPCCGLSTAAFGDKVYVFGEWNLDELKSDFLLYDPNTSEWRSLSGTLGAPGDNLASATLGFYVHVVGGREGRGSGKSCGTVERYDPTRDRFYQESQLRVSRHCHRLAVVNGCILAVAGKGGSTSLSSVERFDPRVSRCSRLNFRYTHERFYFQAGF